VTGLPAAVTDKEVWACRAGVDLIGLYGIDAPDFRPGAVRTACCSVVEPAHAAADTTTAALLGDALGAHFDVFSRCPG
jgi:hypothetical protein